MEILIAITIVSLLGTVTAVVLIQQIPRARVSKATMEIGNIKTALNLYYADNGNFPTPQQGLEALITKPATPPVPENYLPGGYLDNLKVPLDPWGNPYVYLIPGSGGEAFEIISYGADGEPGGDGFNADISSSKQ